MGEGHGVDVEVVSLRKAPPSTNSGGFGWDSNQQVTKVSKTIFLDTHLA